MAIVVLDAANPTGAAPKEVRVLTRRAGKGEGPSRSSPSKEAPSKAASEGLGPTGPLLAFQARVVTVIAGAAAVGTDVSDALNVAVAARCLAGSTLLRLDVGLKLVAVRGSALLAGPRLTALA